MSEASSLAVVSHVLFTKVRAHAEEAKKYEPKTANTAIKASKDLIGRKTSNAFLAQVTQR